MGRVDPAINVFLKIVRIIVPVGRMGALSYEL